MNTSFKYIFKTQVNLIFALIALHIFIQYYLSQNNDYLEQDETKPVIPSKFSENLPSRNLVISIRTN